jgi:hypothetical protein
VAYAGNGLLSRYFRVQYNLASDHNVSLHCLKELIMPKVLLSKIETSEGPAIVMTKTKYMFLLSMPRTSVMPFDAGAFASQPGFQVRYNTSDPAKLHELHETMVFMVSSVGLTVLARLARVGAVPYPPEKSHLQKYVKSLL